MYVIRDLTIKRITIKHIFCRLNTQLTHWVEIDQQWTNAVHYSDVIMKAMASQITSITIAYSAFYSSADQRKHQSSALLAFVRGINRWPLNSPHKGPVTRKYVPILWRHPVLLVVQRLCQLTVTSEKTFSSETCKTVQCFNGQIWIYIKVNTNGTVGRVVLI